MHIQNVNINIQDIQNEDFKMILEIKINAKINI